MSTTSAADLLAHADLLTRQLRNGDASISREQWSTFDANIHRLMSELIGPVPPNLTRAARAALTPAHAVFRSYPEPLRHAVMQSEPSMPASSEGFSRGVQRSNLHAVRDNGTHAGATLLIDDRAEVVPADLMDPHPLARVACTLGAAADLAVSRRGLGQGPLMDDAQLAGTYIHLLALAYAAARHAMAYGAVADADRPLAIAQFAQQSIDALREGAERPAALVRFTSTAPQPAPATANDRLEAAVDHWSRASEAELMRLVPSADTMRMLVNQGAHLYAVTHQLISASREDSVDQESLVTLGEVMVAGSRAFQAADKSLAGFTTVSRTDAEFVAAARELFTSLDEVREQIPRPGAGWDARRSLLDLSRGVQTLRQVMQLSQTLPDRLLRSGLIYAHAKTLPPSVARLRYQRLGRYVPVMPAEAPDLQTLWTAAYRQADEVEQTLRRLNLSPALSPNPRSLEL